MEVNSAEYTETTPGNTITPGSRLMKNLTYNSEARNMTYTSENKHTYSSEVKNLTSTGEMKNSGEAKSHSSNSFRILAEEVKREHK